MSDIPADQRYRPEDRIMQGVIPYLNMSGKAGEAVDFYAKAFAARDIGRMPMEGQPGRYMHVQVEVNGGALMMTDYNGMESATSVPPITNGHLQLVVPNGQEWWDRALAAGCTVVAPYERQFWGDTWGPMLDPFGLKWSVLTPDPALWDKEA